MLMLLVRFLLQNSRRRYEMEVRNQATALERQMRRGVPQVRAVCDPSQMALQMSFLIKKKRKNNDDDVDGDVCVQDGSEYVNFLRESQKDALKEEERRYRFLAEKHCGLTQSIAYLMNKVNVIFFFIYYIILYFQCL